MTQTSAATANPHQDAAPDGAGAEEGFHIDLERYWHQALLLKYWVLGIVAFGLLAGLLVTLLSTELYRATTRIEISRTVQNVTETEPIEIEGRGGDQQYFNTQYELLEARSLAGRVTDSGNLMRDEAFLSAFGLSDQPALTPRAVQNILRSNITIEPVPQSALVDVSFSSPSARVSAKIADLWAQEFLAANYEKRFGANIEARDFLEEQIGELRERLAMSERELIDYATANGIVIISSGGGAEGSQTASQTLIGSELTALSSALAEATTQRIAAEAALRTGARSAAAAGGTSGLRARLAGAGAELAELQSRFGPGYPEIKAKEAEIEALREALSRESSVETGGAQAAYRAAALQEQQLRDKLQEAKGSFLGQQGQSIQYGILQREVETNRQIYDALLQRYKELEAAGAGKNNMTIIDAAQVPRVPYAPSLALNLLIGLLAGLLLSAVLVYVRETMDSTIRDPNDLRRRLGLVPLGLIPRVEPEIIHEEIRQRSSEISEAYAAARTNLAFLTPNGAPGVLMLTSTRPNEGKSLSSVALARSFAALGKRTLLIDADLRHSGLSDFIGVEADPSNGLSALLSGNTTDIGASIVPITPDGIDLLPVGHKPPNPVELLAGGMLSEIVEQLRSRYDQVLIDGAPVLGLADALEVSKAVDGVIYVIESNGLSVRAIENALARLRTTNVPIFGALLTKLDERNTAYGYGDGYGYGYGYGDPDDERAAT